MQEKKINNKGALCVNFNMFIVRFVDHITTPQTGVIIGDVSACFNGCFEHMLPRKGSFLMWSSSLFIDVRGNDLINVSEQKYFCQIY